MALESITPAGAVGATAQQQSNPQQNPIASANERAGGVPTQSPNDQVIVSLSNDVRSDNELRRGSGTTESVTDSIRRRLLESATESNIELRLSFDPQRGVSFIEFYAGEQVIFKLPSERFYDFIKGQL